MKITLIEPQKKKGRYNVYIDDEFSFGIYQETLVKFGLRKNDELSEKKIKEIKDYDELNYGKKIAYRYLSYKQRSEQEVKNRLQKSKISARNIEKIIKFFKEHNFINDENYAKSVINSEISKKPKGKKLLRNKLMLKGIPKGIIESSIDTYIDDAKEESNALKLLSSYIKKINKFPLEKQKLRAYRYLISRGYDYEIVTNLIQKFFK